VAQLTDDGTANAIGIVDFFWAAAFPANLSAEVLVGFEADAGDEGVRVEPTLRLVDPDERVLFEAALVVVPGTPGSSGERWVRYVPVGLQFITERPGEHELRVSLGGDTLASLSVSFIRKSA
jgi:hypothetical protein